MEEELLKQLIDLAGQINSSLDLDTVLDHAMQAAEELLQAEASSIFQVDEERGDLFFRLARGEKADQVKEIRVGMGEGVAGWVAAHQAPLIVADTRDDPVFNPRVDAQTGFATRSILCVPLRHRDCLLGVIQVLNKRGSGGFDSHDLEMLALLGNQIAIALENARSYERIEHLLAEVVATLSTTAELRDPYTAGHQRRVARLADEIARELGFSPGARKGLRVAALLHDIGKVGLPAEILSKPGRLSDLEMSLIKTHSQAGYDILKGIRFPWEIARMVLHHHERLDGSGYPQGLKEGDIELEARIIAVADVVEAVASHRPYRPSLGIDKALEEIRRHQGDQFDPQVVEACLKLFQNGFRFD